MIALAILLLTLFLVYFQNTYQEEQIDFMEVTSLQYNECLRLRSAINFVSSSGDNSQIELFLNFDANINETNIEFSTYSCELHGVSLNSQLSIGNVRVQKSEGVISVENF